MMFIIMVDCVLYLQRESLTLYPQSLCGQVISRFDFFAVLLV